MNTVERYAKAVISGLGIITTVMLAVLPPNTAVWTVAACIAGALTIAGVASCPNQYGVAVLRQKLAEALAELEQPRPLTVTDQPGSQPS